jgi:hypothetical protein
MIAINYYFVDDNNNECHFNDFYEFYLMMKNMYLNCI